MDVKKQGVWESIEVYIGVITRSELSGKSLK